MEQRLCQPHTPTESYTNTSTAASLEGTPPATIDALVALGSILPAAKMS